MYMKLSSRVHWVDFQSTYCHFRAFFEAAAGPEIDLKLTFTSCLRFVDCLDCDWDSL